MEIFQAVVAFLTGLIVGSFLNVVVWRLPRRESLNRPRSHCPGCQKPIAWYDNVPVLSWLLLRARCRGCKLPISARYPFVELLTGVLFLLAWQAHGPVSSTGSFANVALVALFLAALVSISFIDLDHRIIPDAISKPGMVVFVLLAPFCATHLVPGEPGGAYVQWLPGVKPALSAILHAAAGVAVGGGVIWLVRIVGSWIMKKEAMGLGDVKLLAFIGAVVGPLQVLYALALGCLGGAIIGGVMFAVGKRRPMPCEAAVSVGGTETRFGRTRVRDTGFEFRGALAAAVGSEAKLALVLPAARTLTDEDVRIALTGRVASQEGSGDATRSLIEVSDVSESDLDHISMYANSYRYIPFGPFLALGGAITALYGPWVHWALTVGWPSLVRPT